MRFWNLATDPSLVSPSLSTSHSSHPFLPKWPGILLNPVDFYHSSWSSGSSEFLQFACLLQLFLIPLLACVFPSSSSSSDRWNQLPLSVSFLCSQSERYTDDYVASRYLFFPSSSLVKHFCCFMYHLVGNGTQTVLLPLDYHTAKVIGFPPGTWSLPRIGKSS